MLFEIGLSVNFMVFPTFVWSVILFLSRGKGILIHIASTAALFPVPMMTVYSATKVSTRMHVNCQISDTALRSLETFLCLSTNLLMFV